jgi:RNA polymerase sigma-70 factor, ECF subfamily
MSSADDFDLVKDTLKGNISSFGILVDQYQKPVFNLILKMVYDEEQAKDLTQDVFLKVFEKLHRFDFRHKFFSWLYRIAINETLNFLKSRKQSDRLDGTFQIPLEALSGEAREVQRKKLHQSLRELRADQRSIILLKYFFGLSYDEIGEILEIPEKTVKARLFTAREKLRTVLVTSNFFDYD